MARPRRALMRPPSQSPDADALAAFLAADRTPPARRPWVMANMVASLDGASSLSGVSGGLSGPPDRIVFHALRALCDVVLAAAATVRADGYGPARPTAEVRAARIARGQTPVPAIAVVTRSLDLDLAAPLFAQAQSPTIIIAPNDAESSRLDAARQAADVIAAGQGGVDFGMALAALADRGAGVVLCEGGPTLIGQLVAADLLDEMFVAISPLLVGGDATRIVRGAALDPPRALDLGGVLDAEGFVFVRYRIARSS